MESKLKRSLCLKVPLNEGEKARLLVKDIICKDLKFRKNKAYLYIPIAKLPPKSIKYEITKKEFEQKQKRLKRYKEIVKVPRELESLLPSSFDQVGDIALIKIPAKLLPYKEVLGKAMIEVYKSIKVVCRDKGVKSEYRLRNLEVIAGEPRTQTIHKEYGVRIALDLKQVFFSPRLAREHYLIAKKVKKGSLVVDMFAGCGPFSLMIARYAKPKQVYAIDLNPEAIKWLKLNAERNKVKELIQPICKDTHEVIKEMARKNQFAQHIIMNLPFTTSKYFEDALKISTHGTIIHYYEIIDQEKIEERLDWLRQVALKKRKPFEVIEVRKIKSYSPRQINVAFDLRIKGKYFK
jgi:tRNA (guanine37-N1)-methyltransferase